MKKAYPERAVLTGSGVSILLQKHQCLSDSRGQGCCQLVSEGFRELAARQQFYAGIAITFLLASLAESPLVL